MGIITKVDLLDIKTIRDLALIAFKLIEKIFKWKILGVPKIYKIYKIYKIMIKLSMNKLITPIEISISNKIGSKIYNSSKISEEKIIG
jgi:hypothetical protein